ncbi:hypothetical protein DYQ86_22115 [Acidobacteria bacterium AB60]|nr:hypothetical protein DYQ86_22115 [Acidobacteria bacterium AB60]
MKISATFFGVLLSATTLTAFGQAADKATLAAITERGRALYAYDQAAWKGTDAIFALKPRPKMEGMTHYICLKSAKGWRVVFPKWNQAHDKVVIAFEATEKADGKYEARAFDPPVPGDKTLQSAALALELAVNDFKKPQRPYNTAVLPAPGGNFYVYLYPGQIKANAWPIGGDVRYTVSSDGARILDKRQLHKSILDAEPKAGSNEVAGYHFHILTDVPEDTDVLYVMNRKPSMPEYVVAGQDKKTTFLVNTDGSITTGPDTTKTAKK